MQNTISTIRSALIWKKSEPKVFNWPELHLSEVTSYKIHTLHKISKKQGKNDRVPTSKKNIEKVWEIEKCWDSVIILNLAMLQKLSVSQTFSKFLDGQA